MVHPSYTLPFHVVLGLLLATNHVAELIVAAIRLNTNAMMILKNVRLVLYLLRNRVFVALTRRTVSIVICLVIRVEERAKNSSPVDSTNVSEYVTITNAKRPMSEELFFVHNPVL